MFDAQEQEIIKAGVGAGKTPDEIKAAVARYRSGYVPPVKAEQQPQGSTYGEDVKQAAAGALQGGGSRLMEGLATVGHGSSLPDTIRGGTKAAAGVAQGAGGVLLSPLAPLFKPIAEGFQKLTDAIGGTKFMQEAAAGLPENSGLEKALGYAEDVGILADTAGAAYGGAKTAIATKKAVSGAFDSGTQHLAGILDTGEAGVKAAAQKNLDPAGIMQRVARIPKGQQAKFEQLAGQSVGEYLVKRGVFGDVDQISEQLASIFNKSRTQVDDALGQLPGEYKAPVIGNALKQLLEREQAISSPGALSPDLEVARSLVKKHKGAGLTMSEINQVKRLFERNVKLEFVKENAPVKVAGATQIDDSLRAWQRAKAETLGFSNLKAMNRETMLSKQLLDAIGKEYSGAAGNNAVTLTDWIILAGGDPTAVGAFITKKMLSSKKVMSGVAKALAPQAEPLPEPVLVKPTASGYKQFLEAIEGRAKTPTPPLTATPESPSLDGSTGATMTANEPITAVDNSLFGRAKSFVSDTIDRAKKDGQRGFARNPLAGETKKAVSPENIAKNVDINDLRLIDAYLKDQSAYNLYKMQRMLEEMGVDKLSLPDIDKFLQEVMNERGNMGRKLDVKSE